MLLKSTPKLTPRRVTIRLPAESWQRLDRLEQQARDAGAEIDIEGALADYLLRQIGRTERELAGTPEHRQRLGSAEGTALCGRAEVLPGSHSTIGPHTV
jgi:hypothetical protein